MALKTTHSESSMLTRYKLSRKSIDNMQSLLLKRPNLNKKKEKIKNIISNSEPEVEKKNKKSFKKRGFVQEVGKSAGDEYYPDKLKRVVSPKKIVLKPKPCYSVVATTNKRKLSTPVKGIEVPKPKLIKVEPLSDDDQMDLEARNQLIWEDDLTEEEFMEILTCPSPVWWENPALEDQPIPNENSTNGQSQETHIVTHNTNKNDFENKKSKLENILGNIKNKNNKIKNNSISSNCSDLDEDLLNCIENMDIPIENVNRVADSSETSYSAVFMKNATLSSAVNKNNITQNQVADINNTAYTAVFMKSATPKSAANDKRNLTLDQVADSTNTAVINESDDDTVVADSSETAYSSVFMKSATLSSAVNKNNITHEQIADSANTAVIERSATLNNEIQMINNRISLTNNQSDSTKTATIAVVKESATCNLNSAINEMQLNNDKNIINNESNSNETTDTAVIDSAIQNIDKSINEKQTKQYNKTADDKIANTANLLNKNAVKNDGKSINENQMGLNEIHIINEESEKNYIESSNHNIIEVNAKDLKSIKNGRAKHKIKSPEKDRNFSKNYTAVIEKLKVADSSETSYSAVFMKSATHTKVNNQLKISNVEENIIENDSVGRESIINNNESVLKKQDLKLAETEKNEISSLGDKMCDKNTNSSQNLETTQKDYTKKSPKKFEIEKISKEKYKISNLVKNLKNYAVFKESLQNNKAISNEVREETNSNQIKNTGLIKQSKIPPKSGKLSPKSANISPKSAKTSPKSAKTSPKIVKESLINYEIEQNSEHTISDANIKFIDEYEDKRKKTEFMTVLQIIEKPQKVNDSSKLDKPKTAAKPNKRQAAVRNDRSVKNINLSPVKNNVSAVKNDRSMKNDSLSGRLTAVKKDLNNPVLNPAGCESPYVNRFRMKNPYINVPHSDSKYCLLCSTIFMTDDCDYCLKKSQLKT